MKKYLAVGTAALVGGLALATGAFADQHYVITKSKQIKDGAISLVDLSPSARKALKGEKGEKGDKGPQGDPPPFRSAGNWGVINRNVIGSPAAFLRSGPSVPTSPVTPPPFGKGSLNFLVANGTEKVSYGNEIDFGGKLVSDLTAVGFHVYTTGEDIAAGAGGTVPNMPGITFEINPNITGNTATFTSLVFMPDNSAPNTWSPYIDGTTSGFWGLTGSKFAGTPCDINGPRCTWTQVQAYLNDGGAPATILTAAVTKGRDFAWQGAIDGLRINDTVYDFEEDGVVTHPAP